MKLVAVCAGPIAPLMYRTAGGDLKTVASAIHKSVVSGADQPTTTVGVSKLGVQDDEQTKSPTQGGLDHALLMLPEKHYHFWKKRRKENGLESDFPYGFLGENLLIDGFDESTVHIGDDIRIGELVCRITHPRQPGLEFAAHMGYANSTKEMIQSGACGWFARVVQPGTIRAGDAVKLIRGDGTVTVKQRFGEMNQSAQMNLI